MVVVAPVAAAAVVAAPDCERAEYTLERFFESPTSSAFSSLDRACLGYPSLAPLYAEIWPYGPSTTLTRTIPRLHRLENFGAEQFLWGSHALQGLAGEFGEDPGAARRSGFVAFIENESAILVLAIGILAALFFT